MDFSVPSFSLGIDLEDDDPPPPPSAGRDPREQARGHAAPDPPSFSLGFESEDGEEEPQVPAQGRPEEQARRYEAPDAPSFSLGIDDDFLARGQRREQARPHVAAARAPSSSVVEEEEDDIFPAGDQLPELEPLPPPEKTRLKRLRRGTAPPHPAPIMPERGSSLGADDTDDFLARGHHHRQSRPTVAPPAPSSLDIEEEDDDFVLAGDRRPERVRQGPLPPRPLETTQLKRLRRGLALPHVSPAPSPRKIPEPAAAEVSPMVSVKAALGAVGVGSVEDEIEDWTDEEQPARDVPQSVGSCSTSRKSSLLNIGVLMSQSATKAKIPKFTEVSESSASKSLEESCTKKLLPKITVSPMRKIYLLDSDTDADDDQHQTNAKKPVSPLRKRQESMHKYMQKEPTVQQNSKAQGSTAMQSDNWATPALDDFCNDYFKSLKCTRPSQQKEGSFCHSKVSQPEHSIGEVEEVQEQSTSNGTVMDDNLTGSHPPALHYFFHNDPMVRDLVCERLQHFFPIGAESTRENVQSREESLSYRRQVGLSGAATDGWVTPNRSISVPTDVGRRVRASGTQSGSGHWFTGEDGRKVYVSTNGQELTGRDAYRQYQKDSGRGFNKYRKKASSGTKRGAAKAKKATTATKQGTSRAKRKR